MSQQANVSVDSAIAIVPYSKWESYYQDEIDNEGALNSNVTPLVMLPREEQGAVNEAWLRDLTIKLHQIREIRQEQVIHEIGHYKGDIGLIDIQVFFEGEQEQIFSILKHDSSSFLQENLKHIDSLMGSIDMSEMTIVSVLHLHNTDGTFNLHYHNCVFSLRQFAGNYDYLNWMPVLDSLGEHNKTLGIIG